MTNSVWNPNTPMSVVDNYTLVYNNLKFDALGARIVGDFSNATHANRVMLQSSTLNGNTVVGVVPNGTGVAAAFNVYAQSDVTNASLGQFGINSGVVNITSTVLGSGTYLPLTLNTSGTEKLRIGADATGTFTFSGTAPRITGDFSNGTYSSRLMFQTSTTNGATSVGAIPNGTSATSAFTAWGSTDPANASYTQINVGSSASSISAGATGTGTMQPLTFITGGTERLRITTSGNLIITGGGSLGYGTGSGGAVTQVTSRTTAVTLNKPTGSITMVTAAGSTSWSLFAINNSIVEPGDTIVLSLRSGAINFYTLQSVNVQTGVFYIAFLASGTAVDTPVINFAIIKGSTA